MSKEKVKEKKDQGANSKEFLATRETGKKFSYSSKKTVKMLATTMRLAQGKVYTLHEEKADYLISKGVAEEYKEKK